MLDKIKKLLHIIFEILMVIILVLLAGYDEEKFGMQRED